MSKQSLLGYIPTFSFEIPLDVNFKTKVIDFGLIKAAQKLIRNKKKKKKKKKKKIVVDDEVVNENEINKSLTPSSEDDDLAIVNDDDNNMKLKSTEKKLSKKDEKFVMIDEEFKDAEKYNTHMSALGLVIRNIERRERRVKNALMKKKEKDLFEEDDSGKKKKKKKKLKRARLEKKDDEYDFDDNFIDDEEYHGYVPQESDSRSLDMSGWMEDKFSSNQKMTFDSNSNFSFEEENDLYRGKGLQPDLVEALKKLESQLKDLSEHKNRKNFEWYIIDKHLTEISVLRRKYYRSGVPRSLINVLKEFSLISDFSEPTIKGRMKYLLGKQDVISMDNDVKELTEEFKLIIRNEFVKLVIEKSPSLNQAELQSKTAEQIVDICKEKNVEFKWTKETSDNFFQIVSIIKDSCDLHNNIRKKLGKDKAPARSDEVEIHEKYLEFQKCFPTKMNFVEKFREMKKKEIENDKVKVPHFPKRKNRGKKKGKRASKNEKKENSDVVMKEKGDKTNTKDLLCSENDLGGIFALKKMDNDVVMKEKIFSPFSKAQNVEVINLEEKPIPNANVFRVQKGQMNENKERIIPKKIMNINNIETKKRGKFEVVDLEELNMDEESEEEIERKKKKKKKREKKKKKKEKKKKKKDKNKENKESNSTDLTGEKRKRESSSSDLSTLSNGMSNDGSKRKKRRRIVKKNSQSMISQYFVTDKNQTSTPRLEEKPPLLNLC